MNVLCCGTRRTGKSTLGLWLAKQWRGTIVIFDPRGSYSHAGVQCASVEELMQHLEDGDYLDREGQAIPLVYHVDADPEKSFSELCEALFPPRFAGWRGRLALLVDESRTLQSHAYIHPSLDRIVGQAPIDDVLVIQTTHEIKEWNSKTKSVMDEMYLFYQIGTHNYDRIADLCGEDVADEVVGFKPENRDDPSIHHCVRYCFREIFDDGREWQTWNDPQIWYLPLGQQNRLPGNRDLAEETCVVPDSALSLSGQDDEEA